MHDDHRSEDPADPVSTEDPTEHDQDGASTDAGSRGFSRRGFLVGGAAAGATAVIGARDAAAGVFDDLLDPIIALFDPVLDPQLTFTRVLRRRQDFLRLRFDFYNLKIVGSDTSPELDRPNPLRPAFIVVRFPPQHLADRAYFEPSSDLDEQPPDPGKVETRLADESRLAFQVPAEFLPLPFDLEHLLAWAQFPLSVVDVAKQRRGVLSSLRTPSIYKPRDHETGIEIPWFLVLSPPFNAGWAHSQGLVTHGDRTELWHTRLGIRANGKVDEDTDMGRSVQAVWARDQGFDPDSAAPAECDDPPLPFRMSLTRRDRHDIVQLTSDFSLGAKRRPVAVNHMMLSALGGWLDSHGTWDAETSLVEWRHRAAMGRDSYVRIIRKGFLFPFGHKAVKLTITERKFETVSGVRGAYLRQRQFIIVRQPVKQYGDAEGKALGQPHDGKAFPFRSVRITTLVTPDLDKAQTFPSGSDLPKDDEWGAEFVSMPHVAAKPFPFHLVGMDWAGQATEFAAPLVFVDYQAAFGTEPGAPLQPDQCEPALPSPDGGGGVDIAAVVAAYNDVLPVSDPRRARPLGNQPVAYAASVTPGDTTFETTTLVLGAETYETGATTPAALVADDQPAFYPTLHQGEIRLAAAEQIAGALGPAVVAYNEKYKDDGIETASGIFLDVVAKEVVFGDSDRAGGVVTPNLAVTAITRSLGPVGGTVDNVVANTFDVKEYFAAAKILGGILLEEIIAHELEIDGVKKPTPLDRAPQLQTIADDGKQVTLLHWTPPLQNDAEHIFLADGASLALDARFVSDPADPGASTFDITGDLRNFSMQMLGEDTKFLVIEFKRLSFSQANGRKPDVRAELGNVTFTGHLAFVEALRNFLPSLGSGLAIDVDGEGIDASVSLPLPSLPLGVFSLQNLSIEVGTKIPFDGSPARVRFSFCTRENPFLLTITMFGGGGFVGVECGLDGNVLLEVALEFGAAIAFDIGVASGSVEVMAGIYITLDNGDALLGGYLRMDGEVCALGLVTVSCGLYLGFSYELPPVDKCTGQATFYAEIDVLLFSGTVTATVERKFGGENDPTFAQLLGPDDADDPDAAEAARKEVWAEYCNAYEPIGA